MFRALSLDLWFTTLYYTPEREDEWNQDRLHLLQETFRTKLGEPLAARSIETAMDEVHDRMEADGRGPITVDPETMIAAYAEALGAEVRVPLHELASRYSSVGLVEHPPIPNPEAVSVVRALRGQGIPVISITNSSRRGATWQEFLRDPLGLDFLDVVSSVDCGTAKPDPPIFEEASRRLGLEARDILHVGDRWELDVQGALAAGFGAGLYSGLWSRYPEGSYPAYNAAITDGSSFLRLENLEELLSARLFSVRGP